MKTASDIRVTYIGDNVESVTHLGAGQREVRIAPNGDGYWIVAAFVAPGVGSTQEIKSQPSRGDAVRAAAKWLSKWAA